MGNKRTYQRDICKLLRDGVYGDMAGPYGTRLSYCCFSNYRQDRTRESGKCRGGGVFRCISTHCSRDLELLSIKVWPFYLPREFSSIVVVDVLYRVINGLENAHHEAAFIVVGNFNRAYTVWGMFSLNITSTLHFLPVVIRLLTIVIHNYGTTTNPSPTLPHISILLLTYRQWLKQEKTVYQAVQLWSDIIPLYGTVLKSQTDVLCCSEWGHWWIHRFCHSLHLKVRRWCRPVGQCSDFPQPKALS